MSDDFEQAILITFNFTGAVSPQLKAQATAFVNDIRKNPDVWKLCVERFSISPYPEVKFWCLQALHEVIRASYGAFQPGDKAAITGSAGTHAAQRFWFIISRFGQALRNALLAWVQRDCNNSQVPVAPFLRNKLAQTLVAVLQYEYPQNWPSFFHDLIAAMSQGEGVVDMFCRILVSVDEDLVSLDIPRSQDESRLSMHVKDSMREHSITEVAGAWYRLVELYRTKNPMLATSVLTTMQRYIPWIDINLVANDKFVSLLESLVDAPQAPLRGAALDCLVEILSKRMEAVPKLNLVQSMRIVGVAARWSCGFPISIAEAAEDDEAKDLLVKFARLLATLATEIMDSLKRVENGVIGIAALGFSVNDEAAAEVTAASAAASDMLSQLFPALLAAFKSSVDDVALPLLPFMVAYVTRLKGLAKRSQGLAPETLAQVRAILEGLAVAARYPQGTGAASYGGAPPTVPSALSAAQDEQAEVDEKRRDLFTLFKNIAKICFGEVLAFVGALLSQALSRPDVPWQDVEVAVCLLYELGEGAPEDSLKPGTGGLSQLSLALMQSQQQQQQGGGGAAGARQGGSGSGGCIPLACARHRLVALACLEVAVRYVKVLQQHPAAIPPALAMFLDERGMGHPADDVSTRACYLFSRLIKGLRQNVRPYLPSLLASLEPHLSRIATTPLLPAAAADGIALGRERAGSISASAAAPTGIATVDDRLYVFDALGLLLGSEDLEPDQQIALVSQVLQPLLQQIEQGLATLRTAQAGAPHANGNAARPAAAAATATAGADAAAVRAAGLVMQSLEAVNRISKGFRSDVVTRQRPQLAQLLLRALEVAVAIPAAAPAHKVLRSRFISFLHRMVECLGAGLLPYLPASLEVLVSTQADAQDMVDVLALVNQLLTRYKEALGDLLSVLLPALVVRVHACMGPGWDWSGKMATPAAMTPSTDGAAATLEEARERGELQRAYYLLMAAVTSNGLSATLLKVPPQALEALMSGLTRGAAGHVDPSVRRTCLQVFSRLVSDWCDGQELVPGFRRFAMEQLGEEACLVGLLRGGPGGPLDVRDAGVLALLGDAAAALKLVYAKCGQDFPAHLVTTVLPALGFPAAVQQQLVYHLRESDAKELRDCLRTILLQSSAAASGGTIK